MREEGGGRVEGDKGIGLNEGRNKRRKERGRRGGGKEEWKYLLERDRGL